MKTRLSCLGRILERTQGGNTGLKQDTVLEAVLFHFQANRQCETKGDVDMKTHHLIKVLLSTTAGATIAAMAACIILATAALAESTRVANDAIPYLSRSDIEAARIAAGLESLDTIDLALSGSAKAPDLSAYLDGPIYAILECGGDLYIAGDFMRLSFKDDRIGIVGLARMNNIARFDGQDWQRLGSGTNGPVYALAKVFDEDLDT
jgi:hypothetical protein